MSQTFTQTDAQPTLSLRQPEDGNCEAVRYYLQDREGEISPNTADKLQWQLRRFGRWCTENGITDISELDPFDIHRYKNERQGEVKPVTLKSEMSNLTTFLSLFERVGVAEGLTDAIDTSQIRVDSRVRDERLSPDAARDILNHLSEHHPYERDTALAYTLWEGGMRTGGVVALDISDYHPRKRSLEIKHRPEKGTRLKNGSKGEREIMVSKTLADILDGYIKHHRRDKTDDYGREPLFTTRCGRISAVTVRKTMYRLTEDCDHVDGRLGPHAARKGAIGRHLNEEWKIQHVSERCDVTERRLREHYDTRPENEKMEARRQMYDL
jgi:integrase